MLEAKQLATTDLQKKVEQLDLAQSRESEAQQTIENLQASLEGQQAEDQAIEQHQPTS